MFWMIDDTRVGLKVRSSVIRQATSHHCGLGVRHRMPAAEPHVLHRWTNHLLNIASFRYIHHMLQVHVHCPMNFAEMLPRNAGLRKSKYPPFVIPSKSYEGYAVLRDKRRAMLLQRIILDTVCDEKSTSDRRGRGCWALVWSHVDRGKQWLWT
jgi:hypothetical protein